MSALSWWLDSRDALAPKASVRLLLVRCGCYRLGLRAESVSGVVGAGDVVRLDLPGMVGLVWWDGALAPVTDMAPLLGLPTVRAVVARHAVLVRLDHGSVCFTVDEVLDLVEIEEALLSPLPELVLRVAALPGVVSAADLGGVVLIVDPVLLLGRERAAQLVKAAARVGEAGAFEGSGG